MPVFLEKHEGISFVCGREFVHNGHQYHVGDDFPDNESKNVETFVRTRYIIPVIEQWEDKPRHWHRHVLPRHIVMAKLGRPAPLASEAIVVHVEEQGVEVDEEYNDTHFEHDDDYDPNDHKVADVLLYVEQHPEQIEDVYNREEAGKARTTVLNKLLEQIEENEYGDESEGDEDE